MPRSLLRRFGRFKSDLRCALLPLLYPGLRIGKRVHIGRGVRFDIPRGGRIDIGDKVVIEPYCNLGAAGHMVIGDYTFVGVGCIISASSRVEIGRDGLIAAYCMIRDQDHNTGGFPYRKQGSTAAPITLGENVWLGSHAIVLKGLTIGDNAIVGAGAVVTKSLPARAKAVGVPARQVGTAGPPEPSAR